ncbi:MAG: alpha/beta hydrolase [Planctomycetota bacterium]|jgi:esterase/lipase superfamily enzyme
MFIITNREVRPRDKGLARLGPKPNHRGPNELRVVEAKQRKGRWVITVLPDELTKRYREAIGMPGVPTRKERESGVRYYASRYAAEMIIRRVNPDQGAGRNLLFFVHGYNNDIKAVLDRAERLERLYGAECLIFSWPADGGGLRGTVNYLGDKRDAQASAPAFNRAFEKIHRYLADFNGEFRERLIERAARRFADDRERRDRFITEQLEKGCPFKLTMLAHSMGNYVLKHALGTSTTTADRLVFDNIVLACADTNNKGHWVWVDRLNVRNRVYITVNEDDHALRVSRMKPGEQQLARLGHYVRSLDSRQAVYVDFTDADHVGSSHAYFEGDPTRNPAVQGFFMAALNGVRAEQVIPYNDARNTHEVRRVPRAS